ncbi:F-actin-capping protein subunit beta [Entophlyctis sp. JEL0112]|nr:F-actin-capping protein subunit beta [Entophlyctis sp. JEL0112]
MSISLLLKQHRFRAVALIAAFCVLGLSLSFLSLRDASEGVSSESAENRLASTDSVLRTGPTEHQTARTELSPSNKNKDIIDADLLDIVPANEDDLDFATASYESVFNRQSPPGFEQWLERAKSQTCSTLVRDYTQIYRDLHRWRLPSPANRFSKTGGIPASMVKNEKSKFVARGSYHPQTGFESPTEWPGPSGLLERSNDVFRSAGIIPFEFLVNKMDEPQSLPPDDWSTRPYASQREALSRNICLFNTFGTPKSIHTPRNASLWPTSKSAVPAAAAHGFFLGPGSFVTTPRAFPVFSQSKMRCFWDLTLPLAGQATIVRQGHVVDAVPWEQKKDVVFWRGSTTSGTHSASLPWRDYHRSRLVRWALDFAEKHPTRVFDAGVDSVPANITQGEYLVDVGFNAVIQCEEPACEEIKKEFLPKKQVSFEKTCEFKFLIVVDGNTWPNRLQRYLETNSVILYNGLFVDWYIWQLEPMVHYVPIAFDFSDLEEKIQWLMANDDVARRINENARQLMKRMNEVSQLECYSGLMMIEYASLYREHL